MGSWHVLCLSFALWILLPVSEAQSNQPCRGRQYLNATYGIITDGVGEYPEAVHCEWLIEASGNSQYISLDFVSMETECAYDYLFIYDGNSYESPLLGSFSGGTLPDRVLASSGYMLIYFFSDRNYVRIGFNANYSSTVCPHNCSDHGACNSIAHQCSCFPGYTGNGCEREVCPNDCGRNGTCNITTGCQCDHGYIDPGCNFSITASSTVGGWSTLTDSNLRPRTAHAGAFIHQCLYIFGGTTLNTVLDDLQKYCIATNKWEELSRTNPWPSGRHGHAMVGYQSRLYMYGGMLGDGVYSDELWIYNTNSATWWLVETQGSVAPPGLASHSLTAVDDSWLYLFGGQQEQDEFVSDMYRINMAVPIKWEKVESVGGKLLIRRLSGHSAVYHRQSKSLLVFGGFTPDYARFPKRTNMLHAFHTEQRYWSQINYGIQPDSIEPPLERAFHTASIVGNYMVVVGGNAHIHHRAEVCYDGEVYYYHLGCHTWLNRQTLESPFLGNKPSALPPKGRYSHVAAVAFGNTILLSGGYRGSVLGDLEAYEVPQAVARSEGSAASLGETHCSIYIDYKHCKVDPECVWCDSATGRPASCVHRTEPQLCMEGSRNGFCPGICAALHDCGSCTVHGQIPHWDNSEHLSDPVYANDLCVWCVKEQQCQKRTELRGACNVSENREVKIVPWWGNTSALLTGLHQCRLEDWPAGLHLLKYRYPPNFTNPDEVEIVRESGLKFQFSNICDAEVTLGGEYTIEFRGFIHPLAAVSYDLNPLQVYLIISGGQGWLNISTDSTVAAQEEVAALNAATYAFWVATRKGGSPIFPVTDRGYKYYMVERGVQRIAEPGTTQVSSSLRAQWTARVDDSEQSRQPLTAEFLEPFHGAPCGDYISCLACMTDNACGWCSTSQSCIARSSTQQSEAMCGVVDGAMNLILNQSDCTICMDHLDCLTCTEDMLCEWLTTEARCMRRGRFPQALKQPAQCPTPCDLRDNCTWCIQDENECAWCEQTGKCFAFMGYILRHNYGGCTHWVDSMSSHQCHDCSRHDNCKSCLTEYQCGWCGNVENPTLGVCLHGDFNAESFRDRNCSLLVAGATNVSVSEAADWSYGKCPDVEECRLGYHDCHENATCINTFESYECVCNRGFHGDGKETCDRTCYYDCHHGHCSDSPAYECMCDVGWTGLECNTNCGCNNHSYCSRAIGECDECQHHTKGLHCEMCAPGSYGNATNFIGCRPCPCNDHADPARGFCDKKTGLCYCKDNTHGDQCHLCKDGYYGDPSSGGSCYLRCEGRMILGNITAGSLGSHAGVGVLDPAHSYCLWILTVHEDLKNLRLLEVMPTITFTVETDIKSLCGRDYVYVFDGIPSFSGPDPSTWAPLLAAYCGYGAAEPLSVEATSGYLTVYYEANMEPGVSSRGFNASYHINSCPSHCLGNHVCVGNHCDCRDKFGGVDCLLSLCPENCSRHLRQGECDLELGQCRCMPGFVGPACNESLTVDSVIYTPLLDPWRMDGIGAFSDFQALLGHTLVTCNDETLLMFGGYSFASNSPHEARLWSYNVTSNEWELLIPSSEDKPRSRYFHSAVCLPDLHAMIVFGGLVTDDLGQVTATNEIWKFSLDSYRWTSIKTPVTNQGHAVPPMAGHTMTVIDMMNIIIIGGFSGENYFSERHYKLDAATMTWSEMAFTGVQPTGIYGHTAVYHARSKAIYVFGGYEYQTDKMAVSSNLYTVDLQLLQWSILPSNYGNKPSERYMHTAVTLDDFMVVLGGGTSNQDFDGTTWAYKYKCNHWVNISPGEPGVLGTGHISVRAAAAVNIGNTIYHVGGFDGRIHAIVTQIQLPSDLCSLNHDSQACGSVIGCDHCIVKETNKTFCYDNSKDRPAGCLLENTTITLQEGSTCGMDLVTGRACSHYKSCSECLARWPAHRGHQDVCKWCSNCPTGVCVRHEADCERANPCQRPQTNITIVTNCVERQCQASDCDKCKDMGTCIWTRQFKRSSEVGRTLSLMPIWNWNCVTMGLLDATPYKIQSSPPSLCPDRCPYHRTCTDCLSSLGGEGGAQECYWSVTAQECMSPAYMPLRCMGGSCGHIQSGSPTHCPRSCGLHHECSSCLSTPGCGWCSYSNQDGVGVCMEGGLMSPLHGACVLGNVTLAQLHIGENRDPRLTSTPTSPPHWSFAKCPAENECQNGHHTCDESEDCTDLLHGFKCDCKKGYIRDNSTGLCKPYCRDGCEPHGTCIRPDVCECHFGYVGHNCTMECLCNKHSNCQSVKERDVCLACQNNTQGLQCSQCKPLYVGEPVNGGECRSCQEICHQHSSVCLSQEDLNRTMIFRTLPLDPYNVTRWVHSGARSKTTAVCIDCANNTRGAHCETCRPGYFRLKETQDVTEACQVCQCQGHGDMCDKDKGTDCDCKNNTQSPRCDVNGPEKNCHKLQCSECMENFVGTPTENHQCYRQMTVDQDYCLDPTTQSNCYREPHPLLQGRTVFFMVQPKYLNVDIRVTLDITVGGVTVYLANLENAFLVDVNKQSGYHTVHADTSIFPGNLPEIVSYYRKKRSTQDISIRRFKREVDDDSDNSEKSQDVDMNDDNQSSNDDDEYHGSGNMTQPDITYTLKVFDAKGINTFITLKESNAILVVRNVENRLVITLPSHIHELKKKRFFIIMHGEGSLASNETHGQLFFRQDQPHIDLFVFFSVFFSSFFLFLDLCVLVWKIKQAFDQQRSRYRRKMEMQCMASRPFSRCLVVSNYTETEQTVSFESQSLLPPRKSSNHRLSMPRFGSKYSLGATNLAFARPQSEDTFHVNPLALEPTDDGIAAIGTFCFQLPGGNSAPVKACLGSALVTMRVMYPTPHNTLNSKNHSRRFNAGSPDSTHSH